MPLPPAVVGAAFVAAAAAAAATAARRRRMPPAPHAAAAAATALPPPPLAAACLGGGGWLRTVRGVCLDRRDCAVTLLFRACFERSYRGRHRYYVTTEEFWGALINHNVILTVINYFSSFVIASAC
jgi:hypothetical protein